jgi:PTS hybrid protein
MPLSQPDHPGCSGKEARLVGLVLVSHSRTLVEGLRDIVAQFGGDEVRVELAGGTDDGRLGTNAVRITEAIRAILGPDPGSSDGAVLLLDFGSAALSVELALEELNDVERGAIRVPQAPLVEGAFVAGVQASIGASLDEVAAAAESAATMTKLPKD